MQIQMFQISPSILYRRKKLIDVLLCLFRGKSVKTIREICRDTDTGRANIQRVLAYLERVRFIRGGKGYLGDKRIRNYYLTPKGREITIRLYKIEQLLKEEEK